MHGRLTRRQCVVESCAVRFVRYRTRAKFLGTIAASAGCRSYPRKTWRLLFPEGDTKMRVYTSISAALFGGALAMAPSAFADPARDNLVRAEAQVTALNPADATAAAPADYREAQMRLEEARVSEEKNRDEETLWRSDEALLHTQIVQEKIKLHGLERTVSEIETGIATLRREIIS